MILGLAVRMSVFVLMQIVQGEYQATQICIVWLLYAVNETRPLF